MAGLLYWMASYSHIYQIKLKLKWYAITGAYDPNYLIYIILKWVAHKVQKAKLRISFVVILVKCHLENDTAFDISS